MKALLLSVIVFGLLTEIAVADGREDLKQCAALKVDTVRLACFDHISKDSSGIVEEDISDVGNVVLPPVVHSNWVVNSDISQIDDTTKVFLLTHALEASPGRYGKTMRFTLMIACRENTTSIWINFGGHFMSDYQHGRVTYRIDKKPAQRKRFRESNDHEALGLWNGGSAIPFVKSLFGAEKLYVQATPHSESAIDAEFDISGLEDVITPLRESCNW